MRETRSSLPCSGSQFTQVSNTAGGELNGFLCVPLPLVKDKRRAWPLGPLLSWTEEGKPHAAQWSVGAGHQRSGTRRRGTGGQRFWEEPCPRL